MRWLYVSALAIMLAASACASISRFDPPDPRLETTVTIEMNHAMLDDVVKSLSEQSGVTIRAGTGKRDWRVRERRVTIHAKDMPLGALIDQIASLLGYYISREGKEGEWSYVIWQDLKARMLENELLIAQTEAGAQRIVETRQGALDTAAQALNMSPEEALAKGNEDPWLAYLGGTQSGRGYATLLSYIAGNYPTERELMLRGRRLTMPLSDLSPELWQAAADTVEGGFFGAQMRRMAQTFGAEIPMPVPHEIRIMPMSGLGADSEMGMMGFGGMMFIMGRYGDAPEDMTGAGPFGGGLPMGMIPLTGSKSLTGNMFGKMMLALEQGKTLEEMGSDLMSDLQNPELVTAALARISPTEDDPPTDPELTREVELEDDLWPEGVFDRLQGRREGAGQVVAEISRAIGMPVLLESFTDLMPLSLFLQPGKQPFYKILVGLEKAGYLWTLNEHALQIRPDDWALRRSYDIPESFLARYRGILEKNGAFSLDDLAAIAVELTDEQIANTFMNERDLAPAALGLFSPFGGAREILRVYGSMSPWQKSALVSEYGLSFADLNAGQWDLLSIVISDQLGGVYIMDGNIRLEVPGQADEEDARHMNSAVFTVTVFVGGEEVPRIFTETIMLQTKEGIAAMRDAMDAARKAENEATPNPEN